MSNKEYLQTAQQYLKDIKVGDWVKVVGDTTVPNVDSMIFEVIGVCFFDEGVPVYRVIGYNLNTSVETYMSESESEVLLAFWGYELEKVA